ncbi:MAG: ATP phosphoribosyltransferase regulatory subunit [Clostridia bacterium]|nr:ATP phosphoribosyltransferase regulatory subunit [Clostridia bacterium]
MTDTRLLKSEERAIVSLRSLYHSFGYLPFKMSKFEEYDMYVRNKDFLVSDRIITFAGSDGKLLALKPDVTLSIIKNSTREGYRKQKFYYNENVYRPSGDTGQYKEIMQTGIENIGELDTSDICEAVYLAAMSLEKLSESFVVDVSHMGLVSALLAEISDSEEFCRAVLSALCRKSVHELLAVCERFSVDEAWQRLLMALVDFNGSFAEAAELIAERVKSARAVAALAELTALGELLCGTRFEGRVRLDFSAVSNMNYYNGIVFSGYIEGITDRILSGGEYSGLIANMNCQGRAVGFAIYLDLLSQLDSSREPYDVDVLLLYSESTPIKRLFETRDALIAEGKSVTAVRSVDTKLRYKDMIDIS